MVAATIRTRRDTAANWTTANPILGLGEQGWETDTGKGKIGDGATVWASLIYTLGLTTYAKPPTGGDDFAALTAQLAAIGANGGTLVLQAGTYLSSDTLVVPDKVVLRGTGRSATTIKAHSSFGTGKPLVTLGTTGGSNVSGVRVERLTIDCNNVATSTGVICDKGQEMCGLDYVVVQNFKSVGIQMNTGAADWELSNLEVYPSATGATKGIYANTSPGSNVIRKATVGVAGVLTIGIHISLGTCVVLDVRLDNCTDGILFAGSDGAAIGVAGPSAANVTSLVRMDNTQHNVYVASVTKGSATNSVKDDFFTKTITDAFVQSAVMGDLYIGRLDHYGDRIGFFNTTAVVKGAALTASPAAAPAGGTGTAAGGWDTAANRDAAIATINGLRTRLNDLVSRLQAYGLIP